MVGAALPDSDGKGLSTSVIRRRDTPCAAQVDELSGRIATSLRDLGVGRGDKAAVQLPNVPHSLFACFGVLKVGAVLVPLDPLLRAPEICYHLIICGARLLITFETSAEETVRGTAEIDGLRTYVLEGAYRCTPPCEHTPFR